MKCPKCGLETPESANFCAHCGANISGTVAPVPPVVAGSVEGSGEIMLWEGRPSLKPVIPAFLLLLVITAIVYALAWFTVDFMADRGQAAPGFVWAIIIPSVAGVAVLIILIILFRQWIRKMTIHYSVSSQRILTERGIFSKRNDELELEHYKDVIVHRGILDTLVGCGDIRVITSDNTCPLVELTNISNPLETKEIIRTAAEARKRALGIIRREEL